MSDLIHQPAGSEIGPGWLELVNRLASYTGAVSVTEDPEESARRYDYAERVLVDAMNHPGMVTELAAQVNNLLIAGTAPPAAAAATAVFGIVLADGKPRDPELEAELADHADLAE